MFSYRRLSIQRKLQVTTLVAVAVALILSCAAFVSYDVMVFRHRWCAICKRWRKSWAPTARLP